MLFWVTRKYNSRSYGELTGSFEIIITTDPDLVVTIRELTAQEPEDRTLTLNQQIEVLGLKFAVKEKWSLAIFIAVHYWK